HLSPELNTGQRCVWPACPLRQPCMVFLFVGSSALTGGFLPTGVSGKSVDEFVRLALSLVYPSECCIVSHTTELLDSTQKAHFSQFRQPVCHTPFPRNLTIPQLLRSNVWAI